MLFSIYLGYSYAFLMGGIWVDAEFENHAFGRVYQAGDVISVFFGVLFGLFAVAGLGTNM